VTILSLNKTREPVGRVCPLFYGHNCAHFSFLVISMTRKARKITHAALLAALYVALTHLQNLLLPGTTSLPIQVRVSEALCILAFFTPAAIPGLTIGCFLFNVSYAHSLPFDFLIGTAASFLTVGGMYLTRRKTVFGYPLLGMLLPALFNGLLIGWELDFIMGGGFWLNAFYVAAGEAIAMLALGTPLYYTVKSRHLDAWLLNF